MKDRKILILGSSLVMHLCSCSDCKRFNDRLREFKVTCYYSTTMWHVDEPPFRSTVKTVVVRGEAEDLSSAGRQ